MPVGKSHEDYVRTRLARNPDYAEAYEETRVEGQLGLALVNFREEQGLSERALAELSGIAQPMINRLERGAQTPTVPTLQKIARALHATIEIGPDEIKFRPNIGLPTNLALETKDFSYSRLAFTLPPIGEFVQAAGRASRVFTFIHEQSVIRDSLFSISENYVAPSNTLELERFPLDDTQNTFGRPKAPSNNPGPSKFLQGVA